MLKLMDSSELLTISRQFFGEIYTDPSSFALAALACSHEPTFFMISISCPIKLLINKFSLYHKIYRYFAISEYYRHKFMVLVHCHGGKHLALTAQFHQEIIETPLLMA